MAGGHTHTQQLRRVGGGQFVNPGSIGVVYNILLPEEQRHTDAWAEYAVVTDTATGLSVEFRRVPYDAEGLSGVIRSSGMPHAERMIAEYQQQEG
jgi:hypothetical protein